MDEAISNRRASRDFRAKYPDDVLLDQISGELFIFKFHLEVVCTFEM